MQNNVQRILVLSYVTKHSKRLSACTQKVCKVIISTLKVKINNKTEFKFCRSVTKFQCNEFRVVKIKFYSQEVD